MTVVISGRRLRPADPRAALPFPAPERYDYQSPAPRIVPLLRGGRFLGYEHIVRTQPWVFAAVTRLCWWGSRIPLGVYSGPRDDPDPEMDGDLADLVLRPNARMGWRRLIRDYIMWDYLVWGNALCVKWRPSAGAPPNELLPIPWCYVTPMSDEADRLLEYDVWLGGKMHRLQPDDVWHTRWPHGVAPLEALARTVAIEDASLEYQQSALKHGITPRASFTTEKVLTQADKARLREELDKLYAGPEAGGNYAILDKELRYDKPIGVSAVDLALVDQRRLSREEVAAAFDVSPPFLGILDRATFNNISELRDMLFRDSVGPKVESIAADFTDQVIWPEPVWAGFWVQAQMDAILVPSPETLARLELMEQQSSTTTIDERRARRGKRPLRIADVTDTPLLPMNMTPASAPDKPAPTADDETTTAAVLAAALRGRDGGRDTEGGDEGLV